MSEAAALDLSAAHPTDVGEGVLARALTDRLSHRSRPTMDGNALFDESKIHSPQRQALEFLVATGAA